MADQKVSDLPSLNGADVDPADLLYIVDSSAGSAGSKKITVGQFQIAPFSGSTANTVVYLNASKVASSSAALTFDGTDLATTGTSTATKFIPTGNVTAGNGMYLPAANNLAWSVNGSEGMRLTSTGLGIGTSSPSQKLTVAGGIASTTGISALAASTAFFDFNSGNARFAAVSGTTGTAAPIIFSQYSSNGSVGRDAMTLDSSGNLGLGVTPSASNIPTFQSSVAVLVGNSEVDITSNAYYNSDWKYVGTGAATQYQANGGLHKWYTAPSGTAGNTISFTQAMTLDASGNLGIGNTSPASYNGAADNLVIGSSGSNGMTIVSGTTSAGYIMFADGTTGQQTYEGQITYDHNSNFMAFNTSGSERARITSGGDLLVGSTSSSGYRLNVASADNTDNTTLAIFTLSNGTGTHYFFNATGTGVNTAASAMWIQKNSTSSRSINAAGTINASGADYAEYMTKAGDFVIAKGDVCGIDANGLLTNAFADAVSFVVKSTDPSYVGGDSWGAGFEEDPDGLEAARQQVDRIAFAGQVPVNVIGATPGQYIIPVNDSGAIKGEAVSNPTFEQYQSAVGKVIAIEADGRARIIVKVA